MEAVNFRLPEVPGVVAGVPHGAPGSGLMRGRASILGHHPLSNNTIGGPSGIGISSGMRASYVGSGNGILAAPAAKPRDFFT